MASSAATDASAFQAQTPRRWAENSYGPRLRTGCASALGERAAHALQAAHERLQALLVQAFSHRIVKFATKGGDLLENLSALRCERQAPDATILRVCAALDQAVRLQPIQQTPDGDGFDVGQNGKLALCNAWLPLKPGKHRPLRPRHAMRAGPLVGVPADQLGDVVDQEQKVTLDGIVHSR